MTGSPSSLFNWLNQWSPCHDTLEAIPREQFREGSIPVLETKRLALRAPRLEDAKTVAALANDRRIAENTARIPHPYKLADAETFISRGDKTGDAVFLITLRGETVIGACGVSYKSGGRARLLAGRALLGQRLRHRGAARGDRLRLHRSRARRRSMPARASPTRPRAGCWRSAASSGPASASTASAPSTPRRRSTASGWSAASGRRSRAGGG